MARRPSHQTLLLLQALSAAPEQWRYGYELGLEVGLKAGTLYPILMRLCDRGLLEATWESDPPVGRPRRHLYRILAAGAELAAQQQKLHRRQSQSDRVSTTAARPAGTTPITGGAW